MQLRQDCAYSMPSILLTALCGLRSLRAIQQGKSHYYPSFTDEGKGDTEDPKVTRLASSAAKI